MKCDELKPIFIPTRGITGDTLLGVGYYPYNAVDEAIAELKCDNDKLKEALKIKDDLLIENGAEIGSLKADNESLRKAVSNWHDKYCNLQETIDRLECKLECVKENKDKELRATNRALWLARAERAVAAQSVHEWCRYNEKHPCGLWRADPFEYWVQAWICVEKLCRKKAKEYK